jgi:hypothetical protein
MYPVPRSVSHLIEKLQDKDTTLGLPFNTTDMMCSRQTNVVLYAIYFDQHNK